MEPKRPNRGWDLYISGRTQYNPQSAQRPAVLQSASIRNPQRAVAHQALPMQTWPAIAGSD
eukprot:14851225-Alexandrium_andersonii.AAC.1